MAAFTCHQEQLGVHSVASSAISLHSTLPPKLQHNSGMDSLMKPSDSLKSMCALNSDSICPLTVHALTNHSHIQVFFVMQILKGDLSEFQCGMVVSATLVNGLVRVFQELLNYWDFSAQPSLVFHREWSLKEEISSEQHFSGEK